jgi:hypothetical protein
LIAEPCRKSVNPTVYGLASVNFCILLTLHVNEVKLRAQLNPLEAQSHGIVGCGY